VEVAELEQRQLLAGLLGLCPVYDREAIGTRPASGLVAKLGDFDALARSGVAKVGEPALDGGGQASGHHETRPLSFQPLNEGMVVEPFIGAEAAALLQSGALRDAARMMSEADWNAYGNLLHTIKTGEPAFPHVHGVGFFDYLSAHPDAQVRFDRVMANGANAENPVVASSYDFGKFRRIVNVGGGRGGLLAEILRAYPSLKGILYDQPQVVANPDCVTAAGVLAARWSEEISSNPCRREQTRTCSSGSSTIGTMILAKVFYEDAAMRCLMAGG